MEIQNTPHSDNIVNRTLHRTSVVTGLFRDRDSAERAYRAVTSRGYTNDEVNVIMSDDARKAVSVRMRKYWAERRKAKAAK